MDELIMFILAVYFFQFIHSSSHCQVVSVVRWAGAAMALAVTHDAAAAARFGNLVASITIMKRGTGTASPREVLAAESA